MNLLCQDYPQSMDTQVEEGVFAAKSEGWGPGRLDLVQLWLPTVGCNQLNQYNSTADWLQSEGCASTVLVLVLLLWLAIY